jgi:hypothetical protein
MIAVLGEGKSTEDGVRNKEKGEVPSPRNRSRQADVLSVLSALGGGRAAMQITKEGWHLHIACGA